MLRATKMRTTSSYRPVYSAQYVPTWSGNLTSEQAVCRHPARTWPQARFMLITVLDTAGPAARRLAEYVRYNPGFMVNSEPAGGLHSLCTLHEWQPAA